MIYYKTELGQAALQTRALGLLPRQRSGLIMFDGKRSEDDVFKATAGLGFSVDDLVHLISLGLLAPAMSPENSAPAPLGGSSRPAALGGASQPASLGRSSRPGPLDGSSPTSRGGAPSQSAQDSYSRAYPIATRLTAELGLRGFRLNLAVEAAGDLNKLRELAPRIREAVGPAKFSELDAALYD